MTTSSETLRILILGAHPDDADLKAGGCATKWRAAGHTVKMVSMTDGRSGHHLQWGDALVQRRRAEARAAGALIGAEYEVWDFPDGRLQPTIEAREHVIRCIRTFQPDAILTHRLNDYHPDHRYTAQLVQDSAYLITVPAICPDVPALPCNPVILYFSDTFRKPTPFQPQVVVDIGAELPRLIDLVDCHVSQVYEWLPFNAGHLIEVPTPPAARKAWLGERLRQRIRPLADRFRELVIKTYGGEYGPQVTYIEAYEVSEVGAPLDLATRDRLFPFLPPLASPNAMRLRLDWPDMTNVD